MNLNILNNMTPHLNAISLTGLDVKSKLFVDTGLEGQCLLARQAHLLLDLMLIASNLLHCYCKQFAAILAQLQFSNRKLTS